MTEHQDPILRIAAFSDGGVGGNPAGVWTGAVLPPADVMQRLALYLAAEPLQALTQAFVLKVAPELGRTTAAAAPVEESVQEVLARFDGRRDEAAAYLGISRTTLWRKLKNN